MKVSQTPRKPMIFYYIIALLVLMLLNALVFPALYAQPVQEVGYNEFLKMIDEKKIDQVSLSDAQITFTTKDANGDITYYKTGRMPDDQLVDRLYASGATFSAEIVLAPSAVVICSVIGEPVSIAVTSPRIRRPPFALTYSSMNWPSCWPLMEPARRTCSTVATSLARVGKVCRMSAVS